MAFHSYAYEHQVFAFLGFQTKRDIFRIQSSFDKVNIWLESGRWDGRNGISFVYLEAM